MSPTPVEIPPMGFPQFKLKSIPRKGRDMFYFDFCERHGASRRFRTQNRRLAPCRSFLTNQNWNRSKIPLPRSRLRRLFELV